MKVDTKFQADNPDLFRALGNILEIKTIHIEWNDEYNMPIFKQCHNNVERFYFCRPKDDYVFGWSKDKMRDIFRKDIRIDGYEFRFTFQPFYNTYGIIEPDTLFFRVYKDGKNVLPGLAFEN